MKEYTVYMPWIAVELRKRGFKIIKTVINEKKPQFDAYVFDNTDELQQAMSEITRK